MLGKPPPAGCPKGYRYSADFDDCIEDIPSAPDVVVVHADPVAPKPPKAPVDWGWAAFWNSIKIPEVKIPAPVGKTVNYYAAPAAKKSFFTTPAGIALLAIGAGAVVLLATKKKRKK